MNSDEHHILQTYSPPRRIRSGLRQPTLPTAMEHLLPHQRNLSLTHPNTTDLQPRASENVTKVIPEVTNDILGLFEGFFGL